ncbi:predicted protein [Streptomyces sp. C]|nr:predicted protein [Streptomyces sp. C]
MGAMGSPGHQIRRAPSAGPTATARPPEQAVATDRVAVRPPPLFCFFSAGAAGVVGEAAVVAEVLRDRDPVMAQSAVVTHLDRRAVRLRPGTGFQDWARALHRVLDGHAFPARRLREWSLLKAVEAGAEWSRAELAAASDWCQRTAAQSPAPGRGAGPAGRLGAHPARTQRRGPEAGPARHLLTGTITATSSRHNPVRGFRVCVPCRVFRVGPMPFRWRMTLCVARFAGPRQHPRGRVARTARAARAQGVRRGGGLVLGV